MIQLPTTIIDITRIIMNIPPVIETEIIEMTSSAITDVSLDAG
jgi:hypothetical protein